MKLLKITLAIILPLFCFSCFLGNKNIEEMKTFQNEVFSIKLPRGWSIEKVNKINKANDELYYIIRNDKKQLAFNVNVLINSESALLLVPLKKYEHKSDRDIDYYYLILEKAAVLKIRTCFSDSDNIEVNIASKYGYYDKKLYRKILHSCKILVNKKNIKAITGKLIRDKQK